MKIQNLLITLCAGLTLAGCGGWDQNPLDGKKGDFGKAKPVPTPADKAKPLRSDVVKIYMPDFQDFQEGMASEFTITARVLLEGYSPEIELENLADFPGATFNKTTGMFRWAPPTGFVESTGEVGQRLRRNLIVRAFGRKPGDQVLFVDAERPMYVSREFKVPEITSIIKNESFLREGATTLIPVIVFDKDAVANIPSTWPKILFQTVTGSKSLSGLSTIYREESLGNSQYRIYVQVDARDAELSDSIDTFKMTLVANSRFGRLSLPKELTLDIYTSLSAPTSTWTEPVQVKETETLAYKFMVNDPKLEAWLSLDRTFSLPTGSNLTCQPISRGILSCTFTWTPLEGQAGVYDLSIYVRSRNNDIRDTVQPIRTLYFRTQVLPKGS